MEDINNNNIQSMLGNSVGDDGIATTVDLQLIIDCTGSMQNVIDLVKNTALNFYDPLREYLLKCGRNMTMLRIKVYGFRDYYFDGDHAFTESKWFIMPEEAEEFRDFVMDLKAEGGYDAPETSLEALVQAIRSDWNWDGAKKRHITMLFTDNEAHRFEDHDALVKLAEEKGCRVTCYPENMPSSLAEFYKEWSGDEADANGNGADIQKCRRMVLFAPSVYPWNEMEVDLENVLRKDLILEQGGAEITIEDVYYMIGQSM